MGHILTRATLAAILLGSTTFAQAVYGGPDPERQCSTVFVFDDSFNALAGVSISYSPPTWKAEYDAQLDALKGRKLRLGKNWWTSFDTCTSLEMNGTKVPAGSYVAGLHCTEKGEFHLLLIDANSAMKQRMMPFGADRWSGELHVPLTFGKGVLEDTREQMEIEIATDQDNPAHGSFAVRWGTHEVSAKVEFPLGKDDGIDLTGSWVGREVGPAGVEASMKVDGDRVRFDGNGGREWYEGVFEIDRTTNPVRATLNIEKCVMPQLNGKQAKLIFELDGDTVRFAGHEPGDSAWPKGFEASKRARVFEFKREQ